MAIVPRIKGGCKCGQSQTICSSDCGAAFGQCMEAIVVGARETKPRKTIRDIQLASQIKQLLSPSARRRRREQCR